MKRLAFGQFLQVGSWEWRVQRDLLLRHYVPGYCPPLRPGRRTWLERRNRLLRHYARGPLGIHRRICHTRVINALNCLDLPSGARILDAGCGHAYASLWLARQQPAYRIRAIEIDPELVATARRTAAAMALDNIEFVQGDITTLDDVSAYDLILSMDVLEHIEDDVAVLRAFRRALRPGGRLLLHLPRRHQEHWRLFPAFAEHTTPEHVRDEYTAAEIGQRLAQTGFDVESLRYGFSPWGELAFEFNNLFWKHPPLRLSLAVLLHPLCLWLAYMDTRHDYDDGNSLLLLARPAREALPG